MATTLPGHKARVPDYWLEVEPTLDADLIPHNYNGNFPHHLVDGGVAIDPDATPTDARAGTPGFFYPLGSNFDDLAAIKADLNMGDGVGPGDAPWDTKGQYIVLRDGSECHYRLDVWSAGRVP